jgi:hypothetical protein
MIVTTEESDDPECGSAKKSGQWADVVSALLEAAEARSMAMVKWPAKPSASTTAARST